MDTSTFPATDELLIQAAEMRAGGSKWAEVAKAVGRCEKTVQEWPRRYRQKWKKAQRAAEQRITCDAAAESILVLRTLLRSKDERVARDAAKSLTDLRIDLKKLDLVEEPEAAPFSEDATRLAGFLDGKPDKDLTRLAAALHPEAAAERIRLTDPGFDPNAF